MNLNKNPYSVDPFKSEISFAKPVEVGLNEDDELVVAPNQINKDHLTHDFYGM